MKRLLLPLLVAVFVSVLLSSASIPARAEAQLTCADLDGAMVWSDEASSIYLGFFGSAYASQSIMNPYGNYGSRYSPTSVRNPYGNYGSPYSSTSANDPYATHPPLIFRGNTHIAVLTANNYIYGHISLQTIDASCTFYSLAPSNPPMLPAQPPWVAATDGVYTDQVVVTWGAAANATGYMVGVSVSPDGQATFLGPTTDTAMVVTNLEPGVLYDFGVSAINAYGYSSWTFDRGYTAMPQSTPTFTPTATPVPPATATATQPAPTTPVPCMTPAAYLPYTQK